MKILVVGNSQVAPLQHAHWGNPTCLSSFGEVSFLAINGGNGPLFCIKADCIAVDSANPSLQPFVSEPEVLERPISFYDVIIVCALGFIDGGVHYINQSLTRRAKIFEFGCRENDLADQLVSKDCYEQLLVDSLTSQPGFRFAQQLRACFGGKIILQPFPLLSVAIKADPQWPLNQIYASPLQAHNFFQSTRDQFLYNFCARSIELLPYVCDEWRRDYFTPENLMREGEGVHMNVAHAGLVLEQLSRQIGK